MMNKAIVGGILVAVMGGVPGATYLLTKKEETPTSKNEKPLKPASGESDKKSLVSTETPTPTSTQGRQGSNSQPVTSGDSCSDSGSGNACSDQLK